MSMQNELQPGDLVLVRSLECHEWKISQYGYKKEYHHCSNGCSWRLCIPFKGNEHLLGTSDSPEIPQKEKSYVERQREWLKATDCKVKSVVLIKHKAESYENGWAERWSDDMTRQVGQYGIVYDINSDHGLTVEFHKVMFWFPYFCLEVVRP